MPLGFQKSAYRRPLNVTALPLLIKEHTQKCIDMIVHNNVTSLHSLMISFRKQSDKFVHSQCNRDQRAKMNAEDEFSILHNQYDLRCELCSKECQMFTDAVVYYVNLLYLC